MRRACPRLLISTHALREEGDQYATELVRASAHFYPRPPRGGRHHPADHPVHIVVISTHALREEGDANVVEIAPDLGISTHALREEGDRHQAGDPGVDGISTHALREEGDPGARSCRRQIFYFYPRPPRGGRRPTP